MIIAPKTKGFICTTAHHVGCERNVRVAAEYAESHPILSGPKRVLVIGASTGYGLACRIASAICCGAGTVGIALERPAAGKRTATAGYYNTFAFDQISREKGLRSVSINGDAFSNETKEKTAKIIRNELGQVDLVVYSLAAPKRTDPTNGVNYTSAIKPTENSFQGKTLLFHTGEVTAVEIPPATEEEIQGTVKVMGGEDWLLWMKKLSAEGLLAPGVLTLAFSYIGPTLTHAIYKDGTIGRAKIDLEEKAMEINALLSCQGGKAYVSVNKALVTQASAAIPVVPLYMSLLLRLMKEKGTHEDCTMQMVRMFERIYKRSGGSDGIPTDSEGRIRMDDWEMDPDIQQEILTRWDRVTSENIRELADVQGYRDDFLNLFGFGVEGVDYGADVEVSCYDEGQEATNPN